MQGFWVLGVRGESGSGSSSNYHPKKLKKGEKPLTTTKTEVLSLSLVCSNN